MDEAEEKPLRGMRHPDPLETMDRRSDPMLLMERDPLLWHALRLHGRTWNQAETAKLEIQRDEAAGLPRVEVSSLSHRIVWRDMTDGAVLDMWWISRRGGWKAQLTLPCLPDAISGALEGRTLDAVIDVPGANAWRVATVEVTDGVQVKIVLERAV
jgi:hypothetical protein